MPNDETRNEIIRLYQYMCRMATVTGGLMAPRQRAIAKRLNIHDSVVSVVLAEYRRTQEALQSQTDVCKRQDAPGSANSDRMDR